MEALTIKTFKPDKIAAISVDNRRSGKINYKSVKFAYDGGEMVTLGYSDLETKMETSIRY